MKLMLALIALACAGCATDRTVAGDETYKPPVYRTGSNLPSKGGSHTSPESTTADSQTIKMSLPPKIVPNSGS
ncbi:MAG TPA: hypothetical protein VN789_16280 [Casimicrobiaceae bacterium]|nr:hypothetical protein [Casimicrobiaceae bacterium]